MTLVELLVTMLLMGFVSTLVITAVKQTGLVLIHTDDENRGQADAKVVLDRLGRDVRQARSVVCDAGLSDPADATSTDPYCAAHLQVWVDRNSDYVKQDAEVITWRLRRSTTSDHYDVLRLTGTGVTPTTSVTEATSLYTRFAFTYDASDTSGNPVFNKVQEIKITLQYDAIVGAGTQLRYAAFAARLRNKGI
jgi:hypothetical protein